MAVIDLIKDLESAEGPSRELDAGPSNTAWLQAQGRASYGILNPASRRGVHFTFTPAVKIPAVYRSLLHR